MNFTNGGVVGADVSFYQDASATPRQIDFTKMVGQGASFVIVRAGQNLWIDQDFNYNWQESKKAGLPRGSYWFYDSRVSPIQQATIFAGLFSDPPELELWLDLEEHYGGPYGGWLNWKKFIAKLRELLPNARMGIYTGYYYISGRIPPEEYAYFSQFPLWIAWYSDSPDSVLIPAPWRDCTYWQWGTPAWGLAWGCESIEIDMNLFNGTKDDFNRRYLLGGIVADRYKAIWQNGCNKRPAPNVNNSAVGVIPFGQEFDVVTYYVPAGLTASQEQWGQLPDSLWVALVYNSQTRAVPVAAPAVTLTHTIEVYNDGSIRIDGNPYP